jgi:hypothetical protein
VAVTVVVVDTVIVVVTVALEVTVVVAVRVRQRESLMPFDALWEFCPGRRRCSYLLLQEFRLSGRQDLNLRPPGPQPGALPDCATPRGAGRS